MIILDGTVVNVALPAIKADLSFSDASLVWVVNAYLVSYAGCRLLSGRLGDLFGHRRLFLYGIALFTLASLGCAVANSQGLLVSARAAQGLGGAIVTAATLSLIINLFADGPERAKAIGIYGFVSSSGGIFGLLLGGSLTGALNWHWIFLVNIPIGAVVYALGLVLLPEVHEHNTPGPLDIAGAITVTTSSVLAICAIVDGSTAGWSSLQTVGLFSGAAALLILFVGIEARAQMPIVPLTIFRRRNLAIFVIATVLLSVAGSAGIFTSLYLQLVLKYNPLEVGLAFLPSSLVMAALSLGLSATLVVRFGIRRPLSVGLLLAAAGLMLLGRTRVSGNMFADVLPGTVLLALGVGVAFNPMMLAVMRGVVPSEAGLISGIVGTSSIMGTALGLSVLASFAAARTKQMLALGAALPLALNNGYHTAFFIGSVSAIGSAIVSAWPNHLTGRSTV